MLHRQAQRYRPGVSLLVRLWVEIQINVLCSVRWTVSLLVRLWVEILILYMSTAEPSSASLWGCELKWVAEVRGKPTEGQPPCEAVSWNDTTDGRDEKVSSQPPCEAVSWNSLEHSRQMSVLRQPPCEAVSWNTSCCGVYSQSSVSLLVRLWVEMLKCLFNPFQYIVSLLVRLWVEITLMMLSVLVILSASLWGCELK